MVSTTFDSVQCRCHVGRSWRYKVIIAHWIHLNRSVCWCFVPDVSRKQRVKRLAALLFVDDCRDSNYRSFLSVSSLITDFKAFYGFITSKDWKSKDIAEVIKLELHNTHCTQVNRAFLVTSNQHTYIHLSIHSYIVHAQACYSAQQQTASSIDALIHCQRCSKVLRNITIIMCLPSCLHWASITDHTDGMFRMHTHRRWIFLQSSKSTDASFHYHLHSLILDCIFSSTALYFIGPTMWLRRMFPSTLQFCHW